MSNNINEIQNGENNEAFNNQNNFNNEQFKKFIGTNMPKNGYDECGFCGLFFPHDMKMGECCGHCWAFCFSSQFDLINCKYDGLHTVDQIKNYLKKTFTLHPKSCNNKECIYNKINELFKQKKLSNEISLLLGFNTINTNSSSEQRISNVNKKRDITINYKLSKISI